MNERNTGPMPPEYEHLNAPLARAREHVFLINAEMEKLENNPINEKRIAKLQDEKNGIVEGLKRDFELQSWEDGPARTQEIEGIIDQQLGDDAYQSVRENLPDTGKTFDTSEYWQDKYERNLAEWKDQSMHKTSPGKNFDFEQLDLFDSLDDFDRS